MRHTNQNSFDRSEKRPLSALGIGSAGRVLCVAGERECCRRLLEMGFCGGAVVEVIRRAAFGGPIEFRLRGYQLCLRDDQAQCITVALSKVPSGDSPIRMRKNPSRETGFLRILQRAVAG